MPALAPRSDWAEVTRAVLVDEFVVRLCIEQDIEEMRLWGHGIECPGIIPKPSEGLLCHGAALFLQSLVQLLAYQRGAWTSRAVPMCMELIHTNILDVLEHLRLPYGLYSATHTVVDDAAQRR